MSTPPRYTSEQLQLAARQLEAKARETGIAIARLIERGIETQLNALRFAINLVLSPPEARKAWLEEKGKQ